MYLSFGAHPRGFKILNKVHVLFLLGCVQGAHSRTNQNSFVLFRMIVFCCLSVVYLGRKYIFPNGVGFRDLGFVYMFVNGLYGILYTIQSIP